MWLCIEAECILCMCTLVVHTLKGLKRNKKRKRKSTTYILVSAATFNAWKTCQTDSIVKHKFRNWRRKEKWKKQRMRWETESAFARVFFSHSRFVVSVFCMCYMRPRVYICVCIDAVISSKKNFLKCLT